MTNSQAYAIWELCRQGFPLSADEAEDAWEHGHAFCPECPLHIPRTLAHLIARCNREAQEQAREEVA
jgi:hypothetical protein